MANGTAVETIYTTPEQTPGSQGQRARGELPPEDEHEPGGLPLQAEDYLQSLLPPEPRSPLDALSISPEVRGQIAKTYADESAAHERERQAGINEQELWKRRMEQSFQAHRQALDAVPPSWDTAQKTAEHTTDPWAAFGSPAMMFAQIASAFTRQPMINSLNAGAGVLNAVRAGDRAAYDRDFEAWQKNTDLAIKRANMEIQDFNEAFKLFETNGVLANSRMEAVAAKYGDQRLAIYAQNGMLKEMTDYQNARFTSVINATKATEAINAQELERNITAALQGNSTSAEYVKTHLPGSKYDAKDAEWITWQIDNPQATTDERNKKFHDIYTPLRSRSAEAIALDQFLSEHPNATADQVQDFLQRGKSSRSAPALALRKFLEEHPEATSEDIKTFMADYYGKSSAERARASAEPRALSNALTQITRTQAAIEAYEDTALANFKVLVQLGDKVDKTGIPAIERWIRAGRREIAGDVDVNNFNAQLSLVKPEIAKIMTNPNLSGVLTDSARHEVGEFISKDITSKMLHGLGPLLEGDFKRRSDALEKERTKIIAKLHGENTDEDKGGATPPPGAKIIEYDSSGNRLP